MRDAVAALDTAVAELRQARETLPDDMADEVDRVIAQAESLLETLRAKLDPAERTT